MLADKPVSISFVKFWQATSYLQLLKLKVLGKYQRFFRESGSLASPCTTRDVYVCADNLRAFMRNARKEISMRQINKKQGQMLPVAVLLNSTI